MLSMFVNENRNDWDDHLPYLTMAYRATFQKSTSCTSNLIIFGRELNCPIDLMIRTPDQNNFCPSEYLDWLQNAMRHTFNFVMSIPIKLQLDKRITMIYVLNPDPIFYER